jgi:hypothetical protein
MKTPLQQFRDEFLEMLLCFLWREWSALGVAGQEKAVSHHPVDPESLLLFTCSIGRYDQRLFDEVMDWLTKNGRFLNVQRMRNIQRGEAFRGGAVLSALADWMSRHDKPLKWKLLSKEVGEKDESEALFHLPNGRPLPLSANYDATFQKHGFLRNPIILRGYARTFPTDTRSTLFLKTRALFGVNARCDVLAYLALNGTGHPREVARELYYSQKAIHDVMTDMACSGMVHSSRGGRERTFRIAADAFPFLSVGVNDANWINWPVLLSMAETVWKITEELHDAELEPLLESSEIALSMKPLLERLARTHWASAIPATQRQQGIDSLRVFQDLFEKSVT